MLTIYDVTSSSGFEEWRQTIPGIITIGVGLIVFVLPGNFLSPAAAAIGSKAAGIIVVFIGTLFSVITGVPIMLAHYHALNALNEGQYRIAEGTVHAFHAGRSERPAEDQTFMIGDKLFDVGRASLTGFEGFGSEQVPTITNPEGMRARIIYLDQDPPVILRVGVIMTKP